MPGRSFAERFRSVPSVNCRRSLKVCFTDCFIKASCRFLSRCICAYSALDCGSWFETENFSSVLIFSDFPRILKSEDASELLVESDGPAPVLIMSEASSFANRMFPFSSNASWM